MGPPKQQLSLAGITNRHYEFNASKQACSTRPPTGAPDLATLFYLGPSVQRGATLKPGTSKPVTAAELPGTLSYTVAFSPREGAVQLDQGRTRPWASEDITTTPYHQEIVPFFKSFLSVEVIMRIRQTLIAIQASGPSEARSRRFIIQPKTFLKMSKLSCRDWT